MAFVVDYNQLLQQCTNGVHPVVMHGIISQESSFNPFAIGVVNGRLSHQPKTHAQAVAAVKALSAAKKNYSMGLAQVNKQHMKRFGFTPETIFEPCANVRAGAVIFQECHNWAKSKIGNSPQTYGMALSCYYSGNFSTGFKRYGNDKLPYVTAVAQRMKTYDNRPKKIGAGVQLPPSVFQVAGNPIKTAKLNFNAGTIQAAPNIIKPMNEKIDFSQLAYGSRANNHLTGQSAPVEQVTLKAELTSPFLLIGSGHETVAKATEKELPQEQKSKLLF
uniref:VirB1 protein n=1 Tax=Kingella kingae KKC2005004457 TaxID=1229911 RepID=T0MEZ1_KINKI|nr:VirB1 protein [Kingella kingae KKC2005004457]